MSWSLKAAGTKDRVKEIVAAESTIPAQVREIVNANVDGVALFDPYTGVLLITHGHMGGPGDTKIEVQPIRL